MKKLTAIILVLFMGICLGMFTLCEAKSRHAQGHDIYNDAIKTAREIMWKVLAGGGGDGVTIAIADKGRIVYAEGIGVADRCENRLVDIKTRFDIGSTSKMFAAAAILLLVDDKKVGLDEPVVKYIPEFKMKDPRYKDITVRMLFNHSSGIPGSTFYFGHDMQYDVHKYVLDNLANYYLKHAPGEMPIYCNDGFTLAEIIVERVSGEKFVDFLAKRVFKPLGMKHTGASIGEIKAKNAARHYGPQDGKKYPLEVVMVYGAGGLSSTASDLCRFLSSFSPYAKVKILSESSTKELLSTQHTAFADKLKGPVMASDFGWDYSFLPDYKEKGIQVLAKSGGTSYFSTYMQTAPAHGVTVAFSICGRGGSLEEMSRKIFDAVMRCKNIEIPDPEPVEKPAEARIIPEEFKNFAGLYNSGIDVVKVSFDKDNKKMDIVPLAPEKPAKGDEPAPPMSLVYDGDYFVCSESKLKIYFVSAAGRSSIATKMNGYGLHTLLYQKTAELAEPKKLSREYSGTTWLKRNASYHAMNYVMEPVNFKTFAELPGYFHFEGLKKIETPQYAGMAATAFRDQSDFTLFDKNGETWVKVADNFFTPAENFKKLSSAMNRVIIKTCGCNEWLRVEKGAIVKFEKPSSKTRILIMAAAGPIYDSLIDSGEAFAPEGSFIFFAGTAGDLFKVFAR